MSDKRRLFKAVFLTSAAGGAVGFLGFYFLFSILGWFFGSSKEQVFVLSCISSIVFALGGMWMAWLNFRGKDDGRRN